MKKTTVLSAILCCVLGATGNTVYTLTTSSSSTSVLGSTWTDGVNTYSNAFDATVDYLVKGGKKLYVAASTSTYLTRNRFSGHALYIGEISSNSSGTLYQYGGSRNSDTPGDFVFDNEGLFSERGYWRLRYLKASYHATGKVTLDATAENPFVIYDEGNTTFGSNALTIHGPFCGSGTMQVYSGYLSSSVSTNLTLLLDGDCSSFTGTLMFMSKNNDTNAAIHCVSGLTLTNGTLSGTVSLMDGCHLDTFCETDAATIRSLSLSSGTRLGFKAKDTMQGGVRSLTNSSFTVSESFSCAGNVMVTLAFDDSSNGRHADSFDLLTVPDTATLNEADFTLVQDGIHESPTFSVRTDASAHTKTLVLTFAASTDIPLLTLSASGTNNKGISGVTWSDGSTGTSSEYRYAVRDDKEIFISSAAGGASNVFNGASLTLGDVVGGTVGYIRHYGGYPVTSSGVYMDVPDFGEGGVILAKGAWRTRYSFAYVVDGTMTVTAAADSPFRIYCDYNTSSPIIKSSLTMRGPLVGTGALQVDCGIYSGGYCTNFFLGLEGDCSGFSGTIAVTSRVSATGFRCRAGLALPTGTMPGAVSVGHDSWLDFPAAGNTLVLRGLSLDGGSELRIPASVTVDGQTVTRTCGALRMTDSFGASGPVTLLVDFEWSSPVGGAFALLTVPENAPLSAGDFTVTPVKAEDRFFLENATLSVVPDVSAGTKSLVLSIPEATLVYLTASDGSTSVMTNSINSSSLTNAEHWTDLRLPHENAHYYVKGYPGNKVLRTPNNDYGAYVFPGSSLTFENGGANTTFALLYTDFTVPVLRFIGNNYFYIQYSLGATTLHGRLQVDSGTLSLRPYAGGKLVHDGELVGTGTLRNYAYGSSSANPGGYVVLCGVNTNFAGKIVVSCDDGNGAPAIKIDQYGRRMFQTLDIHDGRALGGPCAGYFDGLTLEKCALLRVFDTTSVAEPTRGIFVNGIGRISAETANVTFSVNETLTLNGTLYKEGPGRLELGGALMFGGDGTATAPSEDAANRTIAVVNGRLKPTSAYALDGADVVLSNATQLVIDPTIAGLGANARGIVNVKTSTPFAAGDGSDGKVRILVDPSDPDFAPRSVSFALMTVKSAAAAQLLGGGAMKLERGTALAECRLVPTARAADGDGNVTIDVYAQRCGTMLYFR